MGRVTKQWFVDSGLNASLVRTHGATEVFPPEDADAIVDNTATGTTLRANQLTILDTLMSSTTHLCVTPGLLDDPAKKAAVDHLVLLMQSVMSARAHVLLEFNVASHLLPAFTELPALVHAHRVHPARRRRLR